MEAAWDTAIRYKYAQPCVGIEIVTAVAYQSLLRHHRRQVMCSVLPSRPWSGHELAYLHRTTHCTVSMAATHLDSRVARCHLHQQAGQHCHRTAACYNRARRGAYHRAYRHASRLAARCVHETVHRHRMGRCTLTTPPKHPSCSHLDLAQPTAPEQLEVRPVPVPLLPPPDRCVLHARLPCSRGACASNLAHRC